LTLFYYSATMSNPQQNQSNSQPQAKASKPQRISFQEMLAVLTSLNSKSEKGKYTNEQIKEAILASIHFASNDNKNDPVVALGKTQTNVFNVQKYLEGNNMPEQERSAFMKDIWGAYNMAVAKAKAKVVSPQETKAQESDPRDAEIANLKAKVAELEASNAELKAEKIELKAEKAELKAELAELKLTLKAQQANK